MLKLNIGGFKHQDKFKGIGWTTVDNRPNTTGIKVDLNIDTIPQGANTVDAIYTSHTLEHILPHRQSTIFKNMYDILKPNSLIRIVVPDIDIAVKRYLNKEPLNLEGMSSKQPCLPDINVCWLSGWFFTYREKGEFLGGHVMGYNKELLTHYLINAGFKNIVILSHNVMSPIFENCDLDMHENYSIYMEAQK